MNGNLWDLDFILWLLGIPGRQNDRVVERPNLESDGMSSMLALQAISKVRCGKLHNITVPHVVICGMTAIAVKLLTS